MKIFPTPLDIEEEEGFSAAKDLFGRSGLGQGMSNLVQNADDPLVIAFDGEWGSGKTTFLKMWAGDLRKQGYPVIFFDAFENDYIDDAFVVLARELMVLVEKHENREQELQAFGKKAKRLGAMLVRGGLRVATNVALRTATAGLASSRDIDDAVADVRDEVSDIASTYIDDLFENIDEQKETIELFRDALTELPSLLRPIDAGIENQKPLVFIIDELDRCKPLFALALLERIKHFLSVPNVHFVLGVHMEQLQSSVQCVYGEGINAAKYLQKFINVSVHNLIDDYRFGRNPVEIYAKHLIANLGIETNGHRDVELAYEFIVRIAEKRSYTLRAVERLFTVFALSMAFGDKKMLRLGPIVGGLIILKFERQDLFQEAKKGTLKLEDIEDHFGFEPSSGLSFEGMEWEQKWWTWALLERLPDGFGDFGGQSLMMHNLDREDIVRHTANYVVDRLEVDH